MIITDPNLRPKQRFFEILRPYYEEKGFSFKKSQNKFERKFEGGYEIVFVSFTSGSTLVSAELQCGLKFDGLERIFSDLKGLKKKVNAGYSFGFQLNFHPDLLAAGKNFFL